MIIRSRPSTKQPCEALVERALSQMMHGSNVVNGQVVSLDQREKQLLMILNTLQMSGVLTHFEIGATRETKASTYEKTEWLIRIKFTDDPTKKTGYVADLLFHYYH